MKEAPKLNLKESLTERLSGEFFPSGKKQLFALERIFKESSLMYLSTYRKGRPTELLLIHLTETWRRAIDNKLVVGVVFILTSRRRSIAFHTQTLFTS